jgi:predicted metal-dependent hydrolase
VDILTNEVKEFQLKLEAILKESLEQGSIKIYGNLRIVVTSFNKPSRIAFQKGNTIYVSIKARTYPDFVLRYIIAHELAHLVVKKHTWRFWKIVRIIYPEYERGKEELLRIAREELMKRNRNLEGSLKIHKEDVST